MIQSVRYREANNLALVEITMGDGSIWSDDTSLPADTGLRGDLARWLAYGGEIAPYVAPAMPVPDRCSKLGLKRVLAEIGRWAEVRAALDADPDLKEDWDLAIEIRRADPVTQAVIALLGLSDAEVDAILVRAVEIVA